MSRIRNAWRALMGAEPEKVKVIETVTQTILGTPEEVTIYRAYAAEWEAGNSYYGYYTPGKFNYKAIGDYTTCEQAHKEHPGQRVDAIKVWRIGATYLSGLSVTKLDVKKPKRAKGQK